MLQTRMHYPCYLLPLLRTRTPHLICAHLHLRLLFKENLSWELCFVPVLLSFSCCFCFVCVMACQSIPKAPDVRTLCAGYLITRIPLITLINLTSVFIRFVRCRRVIRCIRLVLSVCAQAVFNVYFNVFVGASRPDTLLALTADV